MVILKYELFMFPRIKNCTELKNYDSKRVFDEH